ncbi:PIN domain-containing protein [Natrialba taiwanensis]|nr:PIN domain-containing protein [Natrialba taiwanensis]
MQRSESVNYLDSSALIDFLDPDADHHDAARSFVESRSGQSWFAPTLVLYEIYRHRARQAGPEGVAELAADFEWIDPVPLTHDRAREAALIDAELMAAGTPINQMDVLIAGVTREAGGTLVTRDGDFEAINGLDTIEF